MKCTYEHEKRHQQQSGICNGPVSQPPGLPESGWTECDAYGSTALCLMREASKVCAKERRKIPKSIVNQFFSCVLKSRRLF